MGSIPGGRPRCSFLLPTWRHREVLSKSVPLCEPARPSGQRGVRTVPGAKVPGLQPLLLGAQWPPGKCPFPPGPTPPSSCAIPSSCTSRPFRAGWCVPRRKRREVGWGLFRLTWAWGTGRKACRALCLPSPAAPRSGEGCAPSPSPTPTSTPGRPSPSSPGTSCTGTAPDGSLAWGQRPHCAQPWAGLGLGHTEPFCPHMGVGADATR